MHTSHTQYKEFSHERLGVKNTFGLSWNSSPKSGDKRQTPERWWRMVPVGVPAHPGDCLRPQALPTEPRGKLATRLLWFSPSESPGFLLLVFPFCQTLLFLVSVRLLSIRNTWLQYRFLFQVKCKRLSHPLYQQEERSNGLWRGKGYLLSAQSLSLVGRAGLHFLPLTDLFAYLIFPRLHYRASAAMGLDKPALPITRYHILSLLLTPPQWTEGSLSAGIRNYKNMCYRYQWCTIEHKLW